MSDEQQKAADGAQAPVGEVRLSRDQRGQLVARIGDDAEPVAGVRLARCFPWSMPDSYISIRDKDGKELQLLRSLDEVEAETRRVIGEELDAQEFVPRVQTIENIDDQAEATTWRVVTDRGPIEAQVKTNDDIRRLDENRVLIKDHAGGLLEVADVAALDPDSRQRLEDHLG